MSRGCVIPSIPDVAFINLEYPSGTIAHVELSWLAPSKLRRTTIVGSKKMVVYDDTSNEPVRVFDSRRRRCANPETFGEYRLTYRTGDIVSPRIDAAEPLALELRDFCDAINGSTHRVRRAALGVEVVRMIEAVDRSLSSAGARVSVDANALSLGCGLSDALALRFVGPADRFCLLVSRDAGSDDRHRVSGRRVPRLRLVRGRMACERGARREIEDCLRRSTAFASPISPTSTSARRSRAATGASERPRHGSRSATRTSSASPETWSPILAASRAFDG